MDKNRVKTMYEFTEVEYEKLNIQEFNSYSRKPIFTKKEWIDYIAEDSNAIPLILRITKRGQFVGYVPILLIRKFGFKMAGSPFRGWSTCWMGIETENISEKLNILDELKNVILKKYHCIYFEIVDRDIKKAVLAEADYAFSLFESLELRIDRSNEELWKVFKMDCRNFIRQFERRGATLEEVEPSDAFAEEYYGELKDVFAKQNMVPTYSCEKVKCLLKSIQKDNVLCLRVVSPLGEPVASSIFFADERRFYFWGGASYRQHQHYRPNEYMIWYAIQYWRERGITVFDMVGNRKYKQKFGPEIVEYPYIKIGRYSWVVKLRDVAEKTYFKILELKGGLKRDKKKRDIK